MEHVGLPGVQEGGSYSSGCGQAVTQWQATRLHGEGHRGMR